jgi:hypothetical protein
MTNQNDTDPQSPRARAARTDPGLGEPVPAAAQATARASAPLPFDGEPPRVKPLTPVPASSSIETLLDGITGPRPPLPKSTAQTSGEPAATFQGAARPVVPRHPTPPIEPLVMTPDPSVPGAAGIATPNAGSVTATTRLPRRPDGSLRPTVQRALDTTVYTTRKAMLRNGAAVLLSGVVVAALLFTFVRWNDGRSRARAALASSRIDEATVAPPATEMPLPPPRIEPAPVAVTSPPEVTRPPAATAPQGAGPVASSPSPARASAPKRAPAKAVVPVESKKPAPAAGDDLDDLSRQIRH